MPITSSAKRALRKDQRRTLVNRRTKDKFKLAIKSIEQNPNQSNLSEAFSAIDRSAKKNLIHPHKAARIKSRLSKLTTTSSPVSAKPKKSSKKATSRPTQSVKS